jgi:RNA polymerase sigma-70 factor (ECF subfamily)
VDPGAAYARARETWPGIEVDEARFAAHLKRLLADADGALEVGDIYLTLACATGDPTALAALDRSYFPGLRGTLGRLGLDQTGIDETLQTMRTELLSARDGAEPRILGYAGRGRLSGWLRSVAVRTGLRLLRATPKHATLDPNAPGTVSDDPELAYLRKAYGEAFQRAVRTALDALPPRDRLLLKQRYRHRLGVQELGALYGVNAGTISRWVAAARDRLGEATRATMMKELGVDQKDLASILRLVESDLDITLWSHG